MKIFIVENHRDTLQFLKLYCEDLGHEVESATTVKEALERLPKAGADLLFCDIGLPDGSGWEIMEHCRNQRGLFGVAMSGFGMNSDSERSRAAGFRHHLLKPFRVEEIDRLIGEAEALRGDNAKQG
jgi:CheY-like chemotaxis protein